MLAAATSDPDGLARLAAALAPDLDLAGVEAVDAAVLGPRAHHTGVVAVARRPPFDPAALGPGPAVLLEDPRHLGNVGAVVRVAAAAGAAGVLTTGARDPWDPAALRGAAGLHFALPVGRVDGAAGAGGRSSRWTRTGEPLGALPADARARVRHRAPRAQPGRCSRAPTRRVAIPMRAGVSSLNLATAVAVALYTARSDFSQRSIVHTGRMPTDS